VVTKLQENKKNLSELEPVKNRLLGLQAEIPTINRNIAQLRNDERDSRQRIAELTGELGKIRQAKGALRELKSLYDQYRRGKERLKKLEAFATKYSQLEGLKVRLGDAIDRAGRNLSSKIQEMTDEIGALQTSISERDRKIPDLAGLHKKESQLKRAVKPLKGLKSQIRALERNDSSLRAEISSDQEQLRDKKSEWREIEEIGYGAPCPRCKQKLTKEHYETVKSQYANEFSIINERIEGFRRQKSQFATQLSALGARKSTLESQEQELRRLSPTLAGLRERKKALDRDKGELGRRSRQRDLQSKQLRTEKYCLKERKSLLAAGKKVEKLKPSKTEFDQLSKKTDELEAKQIVEKYKENESVVKRSPSVRSDLNSTKGKLVEAKKRIANLRRDLTEKTNEVNAKADVFKKIETFEGQRTSLEGERTRLSGEYQGKKQSAELIGGRIKELTKEIEDKEAAKRKRELYDQARTWLNEHFVPAVEDIERHVLIGINEEFNSLLERWFGELIETGDISVRVDEHFTPIIEQGGYELDVGTLSGGEKTSVALAYRLALNVMVKKVCNAMQSSLLILDEPTDGFSKQQLGRLRDVLRELDCEQVIMVSHEKELESFVDRVYHVEKQNGISRVEAPVV
jgi:exonuclease SbcC